MQYTDRFDKMLSNKIREVIKKHIDLNRISVLDVDTNKSEGSAKESQPFDFIASASEITAEAPIKSMIETEIDRSISLDLTLYPRYHHVITDRVISLNSEKRADTKEKLLVFVTAT